MEKYWDCFQSFSKNCSNFVNSNPALLLRVLPLLTHTVKQHRLPTNRLPDTDSISVNDRPSISMLHDPRAHGFGSTMHRFILNYADDLVSKGTFRDIHRRGMYICFPGHPALQWLSDWEAEDLGKYQGSLPSDGIISN